MITLWYWKFDEIFFPQTNFVGFSTKKLGFDLNYFFLCKFDQIFYFRGIFFAKKKIKKLKKKKKKKLA